MTKQFLFLATAICCFLQLSIAQSPQFLTITQNMGQLTDNEYNPIQSVKYYAKGGVASAYFEDNAVSYLFHRFNDSTLVDSSFRVRMQFHNALEQSTISGLNQTHYENYLFGYLPNSGINDVPVYQQINYENIYANISVICSQNALPAYLFNVQRQGNVADIQLNWQGVQNVRNVNGELYVSTEAGEIFYPKPTAYQMLGDERKSIDIAYKIANDLVIFEVGDYDKELPLYLSMSAESSESAFVPNVYASWSTQIQATQVSRKTFTKDGFIYVTGTVNTVGFPLYNSMWSFTQGTSDGFVIKFRNNKSIEWSTFLGGSGADNGMNVAVNSTNDVYCIGGTTSLNFPHIQNTMPTSDYESVNNASIRKGFVIRLNSAGQCPSGGTSSTFATYFGCNGMNRMMALVIDNSNNVYIGGGFESMTSLANLQIILGNAYNSNGFPSNLFISKIAPNNDIVWRTALGNGAAPTPNWTGNLSMVVDLAKDAAGNIYGIGSTTQSGPTSATIGPITSFTNANQMPIVKPLATSTTYTKVITPGNVSSDCYLFKFNNLGALQWASFFGGGHDEPGITANNSLETAACGIEVDNAGNIYAVGTSGRPQTYANSVYIPTLNSSGYFNGSYTGGQFDGFFAKFSANLQLLHSTYIGSMNNDYIQAISINNNNSIFIAGTVSKGGPLTSPAGFPVANGYSNYSTNLTGAGYYDANYSNGITGTNNSGFVGQFGFAMNLKHLTYFSKGDNNINDVQQSQNGVIYVCGNGSSSLATNLSGIPLWQGTSAYFCNVSQGGTISELMYENNARMANFVTNNETEQGVSLYPNPNEGNFTLHNEEQIIIEELLILDTNGRKIWSQKVADNPLKISINLENCTKGIYLLRIKSASGEKSLKFIHQ